jgi:hypothetical protein
MLVEPDNESDEPKEQAQLRNILRLARNHNRKRVLVYNQYVSVNRNGKPAKHTPVTNVLVVEHTTFADWQPKLD